MKQHIIKRNLSINGGDESILKKGLQWYVMDSVGGTPVGFKESNIGDQVFLYETTSKVVWGRGVIKQKTDLITLESLTDIINYSQGISTPSTHLRSNAYWGGAVMLKDSLVKKIRLSEPFVLKIFEVQINQEPLDEPIAIDQIAVKTQNSWITLKKSFEQIQISNLSLSDQITPNLRFKLQQKFNLISDDFVYDIDHFVPKSVGGPGNIEENLIPLSFSVNRNKSDSIPAGLFYVASKEESIIRHLNNPYLKAKNFDSTQYFKEGDAKTAAKQVTSIVNRWEIDRAKLFYLAVRNFHFPKYSLV
jgi:HNH endonuclease